MHNLYLDNQNVSEFLNIFSSNRVTVIANWKARFALLLYLKRRLKVKGSKNCFSDIYK